MNDVNLKYKLYGLLRDQENTLYPALENARAIVRLTAALAQDAPADEEAQKAAKQAKKNLARLEEIASDAAEAAADLMTELYEPTPIGALNKQIACEDCGTLTRDPNKVGLCDTCYEAAELYNSVQDGEMTEAEFKENLQNLGYRGSEF